MISAPIPKNEQDRLKALYRYAILDTSPESEFDAFTKLASKICDKPIALISLVDEYRQWFKSKIGLETPETHRNYSFCAHAILNPSEIFVIDDALQDDRFIENPLVTDDPKIRFYAGVPLVNSEGFPLGTLCIIDHKPGHITDEQKESLRLLAHQVMAQIENRLRTSSFEVAYNTLFDQAPDAVFLLDFEGRHKKVNRRAAQMLGYTQEEMEGLSVNELSAEPEKSKQVIKRLLSGEIIPTYERLFLKKDGDLIVVEINIALLYRPDGKPYLIQSIVRDVSERKRTENELQRLFTELEQSNNQLLEAYDATIEGWSKALDLRDKETQGHTLRVTELTMRLMKKAGATDEELIHIRRGALLHDIGKMGIPDFILHKTDKLNEEERKIIQQHPVVAYDLLSRIKFLQPALDIPYCHHEKWDGSGYPRGLKGEEIPLVSRVFALVDVWDALQSTRHYRPGWAPEEILDYIKSNSGIHFDPKVIELFISFIIENGYPKNAG